MGFAKPIIAANLDQIGEVFEKKLILSQATNTMQVDDEQALLFEPNCQNELINAILWVAQNSTESRQLGVNAYDLVKRRFTWDVHVRKIYEAYNNIID